MSSRADIGTVVVPYESVGVLRNYDFFTGDDAATPYIVTKPVCLSFSRPLRALTLPPQLPCDRDIHNTLHSALESSIPSASNDLFNGKQARVMDEVKNASTDR